MTKTISKPKTLADQEAAEIIANSLNNIIKKNNQAILAVPGGRSVYEIFELLKTKKLPWKKIHLFIVDERMVPLRSRESNYQLVKTFLKILPKKNLHPFNMKKGIYSYQQELENLGGKFDLVLLSSGEDGHIAGLFPNHHSIKDQSEYFITMNDSPKLPKERMTSSLQLLKKSDTIVVVFFGESKRQALQNYKDQNLPLTKCPAKVVDFVKEGYLITDLKN